MYKRFCAERSESEHLTDRLGKSGESGTAETENMEFSNPEWQMVSMNIEDLSISDDPDESTSQQELTVEDVTKRKWEREQDKFRRQVLLEDVDDWSRHHITTDNSEQHPFKQPLRYIGGVDISFVKGDHVNACAAFVILSFPELEVVYEDLSMVQLTAPYIPGFLAFREADYLVEKINKIKIERPDIVPQVLVVDGNGILHPKEYGLACHLGIVLDMPTIGAAKNLFQVDGLEKNDEFQMKIEGLKKGGDSFPLVGLSGKELGMALRGCDSAPNPIYISPGHKITTATAMWVVQQCCKYRIPEPTRQADILSREYLRKHWKSEHKSELHDDKE